MIVTWFQLEIVRERLQTGFRIKHTIAAKERKGQLVSSKRSGNLKIPVLKYTRQWLLSVRKGVKSLAAITLLRVIKLLWIRSLNSILVMHRVSVLKWSTWRKRCDTR